jgi:hypothetical protein
MAKKESDNLLSLPLKGLPKELCGLESIYLAKILLHL